MLKLTWHELEDDPPSMQPRARRRALERLAAVLPEDLAKHAARVATLAERVGRRLDLPEESIEELSLAARLHDVGKVAVPDRLMSKTGPLDELEWRLVRWHTLIGERMVLHAVPSARELAALVRYSHERWDGFGYPDGLAGEAIPVGARIIFVCDSFDAITSARPYRERRTARAAFAELRRCSGSQFDAEVVGALAEVMGCV
jgi:HD-GYP domain-containing protein (c-di-GMP phosphodiesterase class II)